MMSDELTYPADYMAAVMALRALPPALRALALGASIHWSNEELIERALNVPLDGEARGILQ